MVHLFSLQCLSSLWFSYTCLVFSNALLPPQLCDYRVPTISFPLKGWFLGEEKGRNRTPRLGSVNPCGVFPLLFISDLPQTIPPRLDALALLFSTFRAAAQDRSPSCVLAECCAAPQLILQPHTILAPGVKTCRHTGSIVTTNVLLSKHNWCFSMVLTQQLLLLQSQCWCFCANSPPMGSLSVLQETDCQTQGGWNVKSQTLPFLCRGLVILTYPQMSCLY